MTWWVGLLFAIGAACFAVGAAPGYIDLVGPQADASTYFVGSIFFTTAAFLEYLQVVNADRLPFGADGNHRRQHRRILSFEPRRIDWCAVAIQFSWRPRVFEWRVANLNIVGSIAFGVCDGVEAGRPGHDAAQPGAHQPRDVRGRTVLLRRGAGAVVGTDCSTA